MPTTREIRRRIKSVGNTAQITRAMEMVAASKMRRAQAMALATRPYSEKMLEVLRHLAAVTEYSSRGALAHPLLQHRELQAIGLILITPDRGLAGGMNAAVLARTASFILEQEMPTRIIAVGRKGRDWANRRGLALINEFSQIGDKPDIIDTLGISHAAIDAYLAGTVDAVYFVHSQFVSTIVQRPFLLKLLPLEPEPAVRDVDYLYEPDPVGVLSELLPRFVEILVYHAVLESIASEQSARMVAMRNATDAAKDLTDGLTLTYNRVRQAAITREIAEIAAAGAVLK